MKLYLYQKCQKLNFDIYTSEPVDLQLGKALHVLIADFIFLLHFFQKLLLIIPARNLAPFLVHDLAAKLELAIMLVVAFGFAAKRTEETGRIANSIWVSFIMNFAVIKLIKDFLNLDAVFGVLDIMLTITILTIAGAGEVAVLIASCHPFQYVKIIINE